MKFMKKILPIMLALVLVLAAVPMAVSADTWDGKTVATGFASGTGTAEDPYIIKTAAQLAYLATQTNADETFSTGKYFKLEADIDLGNQNWTPIANAKAQAFRGTFDGDNHTISGLCADLPDATFVGLFGYIEEATIQNLSILGTKVAGKKCVGPVAGQATYGSSIINVLCQVDLVHGQAVGGIVGRLEKLSADASAKRCQLIYCTSNNGLIKGEAELEKASAASYVGGIVGAAGFADIRYCVNKSPITLVCPNKASYAGGLIGMHGASSGGTVIDHCINTGDLTSEDSYASLGGLAGKAGHVAAGGKLIYNINIGNVTGENVTNKGGICGVFGQIIEVKGYAFNYTIGSDDTLPFVSEDSKITAETCDDFYNYEKSAIFYITAEDVTGANGLSKVEGFTSDIWKNGVTIPEADYTKVMELVNSGNWEEVPAYVPAETTTEKPADTTAKPADTTAKPADTTAKPADTTAKPADAATTAAPSEGGCGSVATVSATAVVVAFVGVAFVAKKKED